MASLSDKKILICNSSTRDVIEKKILKSYLDEQIKFLLERIHTLYPELFTENDLKKEWKNYQKWKPKLSMSKPSSNNNSSKSTTNGKTNGKTNQKINSKSKSKEHSPIPDEEHRCIARVFDVNKIIYKYPNNSIKNLRDKELKTSISISNSNSNKTDLINIDKLDKYTFGRRCYGKRVKDGKYCFVHQRNNPHGDFNTPVAPYLKDHFIKMYNRFS